MQTKIGRRLLYPRQKKDSGSTNVLGCSSIRQIILGWALFVWAGGGFPGTSGHRKVAGVYLTRAVRASVEQLFRGHTRQILLQKRVPTGLNGHSFALTSMPQPPSLGRYTHARLTDCYVRDLGLKQNGWESTPTYKPANERHRHAETRRIRRSL